MLRQLAECSQCTLINVCHILPGVQKRIKPVLSTFRQNNGAMAILVQALLENTPTEIVSLPLHHRLCSPA